MIIDFSLFLHSFLSLIVNCLSLLFETQRRPRRLNYFFLQTRNGGQTGILSPGMPHRAQFHMDFSLTICYFEQIWGIKVCFYKKTSEYLSSHNSWYLKFHFYAFVLYHVLDANSHIIQENIDHVSIVSLEKGKKYKFVQDGGPKRRIQTLNDVDAYYSKIKLYVFTLLS